MQPKISVIVPVYKAEKYLHRCVDSILAQTFTDFELILVNDGSPDNCGAICDEYAQKDNRVRVFHKENGGVSSARNLGLENAKGEWITFIDSDDWIKLDYLENLTQQLDADMIKCEVETSDKIFHWQVKGGKYGIKDFIEKYENNFIARASFITLFKTSLIRKFNILFDEHIRYGEDMIFNLSYLSHCQNVRLVEYNGYIYFFDTTNEQYSTKYKLSLNEIKISLRSALDLRVKLKEITGANVDMYHDFYLYFSMIPIIHLANHKYLSEFFKLCKIFIPSIDEKSFYNTSYISPIMRGLSELKKSYENKSYTYGKELYLALNKINGYCKVKLQFAYKDFYIWNWLIKHQYYCILDLTLRLYFYLKRIFTKK